MPRRQAVASPKAIAPPQADALRSGANGFDEAYQHGDDRFVECHGFVEYRSVGFVPASSDIEPSDDFDRRASCDSIDVELLVVEGHGHFFVADRCGLRIDFVPVL